MAFFAEVSAARFTAFERIQREQFGELQVIGDAAGVFEALVQIVRRAGHRDVVPELVAQLRDFRQRPTKALFGPRHANVVPHDAPELAVDLANASRAFHRQQPVDVPLNPIRRFLERVVIRRHLRQHRTREVMTDRVGNDEIAVGQTLHQRTGAQAIGAMIGKVRLAEDVKAWNVAHQVVVDP